MPRTRKSVTAIPKITVTWVDDPLHRGGLRKLIEAVTDRVVAAESADGSPEGRRFRFSHRRQTLSIPLSVRVLDTPHGTSST